MLRVLTYNIKTGGRDRGGADRLDALIRVVAAQGPDVLALQELRDFSRTGRLDAVAGALGMRPYLAPSWFGQPVAVLVRPPARVIRAAPVRRPFHHAAQRLVVATDRGPLTLLGTHLDPYSGSRRRIEAGWLAAAAGRGGDLAVLLGDLNSLDPWTGHDERVRRLPPAYRRRHLRRDRTTVDTRAVGRLDRAGLVDLFGQVGTGAGETAPTGRGGGTEFSGMRLDYVFATPGVARLARRCVVVRGGEAEWASDHYPVLAELDLSFA
jgi:endonuclease/exonuclease/phosphatase family metal-dependent hydrolase